MTATQTITPFVITVTAPARLKSAWNFVPAEQGPGQVCLNVPMYYQGNSVTLSVNVWGGLVVPGQTQIAGNQTCSSTFNVKAGSVQQLTTFILTATFGASGSTVDVWPGYDNSPTGPPNGCPNCMTPTAGNPINLMNGNVWVSDTDYSLPGLGGGITLTRTWNSQWTINNPVETAGMFGDSWRSTYEERLSVTSGSSVKYWKGDGSAWLFRYSSLNQT